MITGSPAFCLLPSAYGILSGVTSQAICLLQAPFVTCLYLDNLQSPKPMIPFVDALDIILKAAPSLAPQNVKLEKCLGRVLAEDFAAPAALPEFPTSSVEGYAVCASDLLSAGPGRPIELSIVGESTAGNPSTSTLESGQTIIVTTGAKIPRGADAVIKSEDVQITSRGGPLFPRPVARGALIKEIGSDVRPDEKVLAAGTLLGAPEIGMLASFGRCRVNVHRRLRVNILATGDELVGIHKIPREGQIFGSTSYLLSALIKSAGGRPGICGIAPDRKGKLRNQIAESLEGCDLLLITGGTSRGKHDFVREVLKDLHVDLLVQGIRMRPGRPVLFGMFDQIPVFGLPGSPLSTYVAFHVLVPPVLCKMSGRRFDSGPILSAEMQEAYLKEDDRRHFVPGQLSHAGPGWRVRSVVGGDRRPWTTMVMSNCLIVVPEQLRGIKAGGPVEVKPISFTNCATYLPLAPSP
jgi:molybdopterin molybdotransferase